MNINEIAKLSDVSRATVSRYLNNGYVSEEKRERIAKIIEQTGYQPSSSAQMLRSKKTNYIGVIIPKIDSASISRMVKGISEVLSAAGYQLLLACTNNQEQEELKYLTLFKENHVDGIILLGTIFTKAHKKHLEQLTVPIVILGQYYENYTCVYHDDYHAAKAITSKLCETGNVFGYIGVTTNDEAVGAKRTQGFLDSLTENQKLFDPACLLEGQFTISSGYESTRKLLSAHPEIDTLLCATDTIAIGALKYIHEKKLSIPDTIQIAGFGDSPIATVTTPALTTIHFHYKTAGIEATKLLLDMISNKEHIVPKELKLGFSIMEHDSTRKKNVNS